jgi:hypothetical protein
LRERGRRKREKWKREMRGGMRVSGEFIPLQTDLNHPFILPNKAQPLDQNKIPKTPKSEPK